MSGFALVHGGSHGAWCWEKLIPHLEADPRVEAVIAIDLSGHGARADVKPLGDITHDDYVDDVVGDIERADLRDVVLVGHSLAGITIPLVAARIPDRIRRVVHLTTSIPPEGKSINDLMKHPLSPLSREVPLERMFGSDLEPDTLQWLMSNLGPEPPLPLDAKMPPWPQPARIPSVYVVCERDEALPPEYQREQISNGDIDDVVTFDSGHSGFASRPAELAELLLQYA